jgi:hypothetical protein
MNQFSNRLAILRTLFVCVLALPFSVFAQSETQIAYEAGAYDRSAKLGAAALARDPGNNSLRLIVANSLAWTGRLDAAILQYEKLFGTALENSGKVGIANIMRWRGRANA